MTGEGGWNLLSRQWRMLEPSDQERTHHGGSLKTMMC